MATREIPPVQSEGRKDGLSDAKRRLLEQRLRGSAPGWKKQDESIHPRPPGASIPLSAEQRRVWLHAAQQPELPVYNEPFTIRRHGSFDPEIFRQTLQEVLRRHEAWRTSFAPDGEEIVHQLLHIPLPFVDLSMLPRTEAETESLRIATADTRKPISLDTAPLFRAHIIRIAPDEHRIYFTFHHIIFDGVSIARVFMPELTSIYASLERGKPSALPFPSLQYGDYAIWRAQHVSSPEVTQHLAYWLENLSGELPTLQLPEDKPRPPITSYRGSMACFDVSAELVNGLRVLSRKYGVTLYMTLLAAFKTLLFRYTAQNDVIVGTATDARRRPELENVIGYFLDTFAVRSHPFANLSFSDYLLQVRDSVLGGIAAAELPFDRVVQAVNPRRDTSRHPIFQAFFTVRPPMPPIADGWNISETDVTVGTSKFDLYLEFGDRPNNIDARFFYNTDIWDAITIQRMVANLLVLLQSIVDNPESPLGSLGILTREEQDVLLGPNGWNDTVSEFPQITLQQLIEDQIRKTPKALAVVCGAQAHTYEQLNVRIDQLATQLRSLGVKRGSLVAVAVDRSIDLLAGLLAILKLSAAYLPLDIQAPSERIVTFLADARPVAILTQRTLLTQIGSSAAPVLLVDELSNNRALLENDTLSNPSAQTEAQIRSSGSPDDTAYLIYTSGTTGQPKAVEILQRSLVNLLLSMQRTPGYGPSDILLAITPMSFDIAALEMFLPLISGGTVVIATREEARDPFLLAKVIQTSGCTVMQATPSTWRNLLLSGWDNAQGSDDSKQNKCLRILCGGEALPCELADKLLAVGAEVWNMYGPTETTIWSVIDKVGPNLSGKMTGIPVGRPIANTEAYVLDAQLRLTPIGVQGELFLGGIGLAKGYRGQPQLTADRFVRVHSISGRLVYRTGDLARRRPDGKIQVLGRTDNQVKIRGSRIELEEVEAAVLKHSNVAAAAARAWPETSGEMRLSLYLVERHSPAPTLHELRVFLEASLPESMIPSDLVVLPFIPLTPHGKIDRAKLPAPVANEAAPAQKESSSEDEERIVAMWAHVLGRKYISPTDNFFDLGGHSMLMAALQLRITSEFGRRISLAELFHNPTVRQQARLLRRSVHENLSPIPGVIPLQSQGTGNSIFWVHYLNGNLAEMIGTHRPFLSLALTSEDIAALGPTPTLESIAQRHVLKILASQTQGPYIIGGLCASGILAFEIATQLKSSGHEVSLLVLLDARNPSYLERRRSLLLMMRRAQYSVQRVIRTGLRKNVVDFRKRLFKRLSIMAHRTYAKTELGAAQEMIEAAALTYRPAKYQGKVLLLMASDRPPQVDYLDGWRSVIAGDFHFQYVDGHHSELIRIPHVRGVAEAINSHLQTAG
ncbi:amino acid adenylation domain-containing protein [Acidicapsa dinghuensis]|uniref:Amino acid adenylation domain-containing protein n=1 Tax=Acidicapsa dinghuensis TaxID=2218256 RepID=A0ABW1EJM0_9BACT|nr:amino acid adenylation domain-containing protein [Acidicapsa dinghuensis]